jgi:hypothetical protein
VDTRVFAEEVGACAQRSALLGVPNVLLVGEPLKELTPSDVLARMRLPRGGDLVCSDGRLCYLFLSSCPKGSVENALSHVFSEGLKDCFDSWELLLDQAEILARLARLPRQAQAMVRPPEADTQATKEEPLRSLGVLPTRVTRLPENFFSRNLPVASSELEELDSSASPDLEEALPELGISSEESAQPEGESAIEAEAASAEALPLEDASEEARVPASPALEMGPETENESPAVAGEALTPAQAAEASADSLHEFFQRLSVHFDAQAAAMTFPDSGWAPPSTQPEDLAPTADPAKGPAAG